MQLAQRQSRLLSASKDITSDLHDYSVALTGRGSTSQVVTVCEYVTAYLIQAGQGSKVVVQVLNVKRNPLTMVIK